MSFIQSGRRRLRAAIAPAVFLVLTGYFTYGARQGDRGLDSYDQRAANLADAQKSERDAILDLQLWEHRVDALRNNHLDPDALEERSRAMLNLSQPGDIIVPLVGKNRLF